MELVTLDPTIKLDIRYATTHNFTGKVVYPEARAFLQRPAAESVLAAHKELARHGYGLLIHDGYRPWTITKLFWDMTAGTPMQEFVADPKSGSKHNRGCAVGSDDVRPRQRPGSADAGRVRRADASARIPTYRGGKPEERGKRDLLRAVMERHGFTVEPNEWWHFNYKDWQSYPILDISFAEASKR